MRSAFSLPGFVFFGLPLLALAGLLAVEWLYLHPYHGVLSERDLEVVTAKAENVEFVPAPERWFASRHKPAGYVELRLEGWAEPFRFDAQWRSVLGALARGTPLSVGIDPDVMSRRAKPGFLRPVPSSYWPLTVRLREEWWDAGLAKENALRLSNHWVGPWLCLLLTLLGVVASTRRCVEWMKTRTYSRLGSSSNRSKGRLKLRLLKKP